MEQEPTQNPTPAAPTPATPRTVEQISALAQEYADGKTLKRVEVVSFMRDLLALFAEPPVVTISTLASDLPIALPERIQPITIMHDAVPNMRAMPTMYSLAAERLGVEPAVSVTGAIFLPPCANRHYSRHEARVLGAKLIVLANRLEAAR